jgi:hypothetical protein
LGLHNPDRQIETTGRVQEPHPKHLNLKNRASSGSSRM